MLLARVIAWVPDLKNQRRTTEVILSIQQGMSRYLRTVSRRRMDPPRHHVPASADFADAVALGLGWGMLPDSQREARSEVVDFDPSHAIDVPLYWQQWDLRSPLLDAVADEVLSEARRALSERRTPERS